MRDGCGGGRGGERRPAPQRLGRAATRAFDGRGEDDGREDDGEHGDSGGEWYKRWRRYGRRFGRGRAPSCKRARVAPSRSGHAAEA